VSAAGYNRYLVFESFDHQNSPVILMLSK